MVRLVSLLIVAGLTTGVVSHHKPGHCGETAQRLGICTSVIIEAARNVPGETGPPRPGNAKGSHGQPTPAPPVSHEARCMQGFTDFCRLKDPATGTPTPSPSPERPPVTITDIATFRPIAPTATSEPSGGWAVLNRHTNFIASTSEHVVGGQLFGTPAEVRFTPVAYVWQHSDGTTLRTSTPGATWKQLRQPEFSATATSHKFTSKQTFSTTLTVEYNATYRIGGGAWIPITGAVAAQTAIPNQVRVFEIDTVLVNPEH